VQKHYEAIRQLGGEVVAVSFSKPEVVAAHLALEPLPFPMLADPEMTAYRAFGLGRTSWGTFFRGRVLGRYLRLIFRGWRPRKLQEGDDLLQLGGDFVLDRQRRLVYAYRSADPTDRPPPEDLVRAVRAAAGRASG
jgi:peroxiredoxin